MRRAALFVAFALLVVGTGVGASLARSGSAPAATAVRDGGTFRIAHYVGDVGIDPALISSVLSDTLLQATCAKLMNYRDRPSPAGLQVVPEAAAASRIGEAAAVSWVAEAGVW